MRIIITGTPGTGKSLIAQALGKRLKYRIVNDREFCSKKKIGKKDPATKELIVPIRRFAEEMNRLLKREKNIIAEGHLLCEAKLKANLIFVLRTAPDILEKRLSERKYSEAKIQDNVMCEGIDYCKSHALKNYGKEKIIDIINEKSPKIALGKIIKAVKQHNK